MEVKERITYLRESIKNIELARYNMYRQLAEELFLLDENESQVRYWDRLPACEVEKIEQGDSPMYRLHYEGILPMYDEDKDYAREVNDYYIQTTLQAHDWLKERMKFEKGLMVIQHSFSDLKIRDLDNRNRKALIDAVRATCLIRDDSWQYLEIMEIGTFDKSGENSVNVFIGDSNKRSEILSYIDSLHI